MENTSKALLIAAAVLVAIIIIAFGIKIFSSSSKASETAIDVGKTIEDKTMNSKNNINRDINFDNISSGLNYHKKEILWETEEEKEKLIFFIYFTSAYIIYLKDKSTAMDDNDNLEEEENDIEFNFNTLGKKIKNLLNSSRNLDDTYINNPTIIKNAKRYNSLSQSIKSSTYTKAKINKFHNEEITSTMNNNTNYNNYLFGENEKKKKRFLYN